ncbi:thioredoxin family protein [Paenibacillus sp. GCM10027626]|uniref:thioredoxin family protein n=1 Tax=Paenibacillus sp. GCM10027626 TaxID=3273411 RepID=UPI00363E98A9
MKQLHNLDQVINDITGDSLALLLIKTGQCGVCESVHVKISAMLNDFPAVSGSYVYIADVPDIAAHHLVLTAPTLLIFYRGKEVYRASRFIRFDELKHVLTIYSLEATYAEN